MQRGLDHESQEEDSRGFHMTHSYES
jgi:hypothetical protein